LTFPLAYGTVSNMKKLVALRKKRKISQRGLAELSGISYVSIARIETGMYDPRLSTLRALAKALKVKVSALVD
jgi:transcriptional regulator with XRE-family HTH domain